MDTSAAFSNINWLSVFLAAVSTFIIGGIWYGPLFGKAWMVATGYTEDYLRTRNLGKVFGISFVLMLVAAINLEMFIGKDADMAFGSFAGLFAGLGWVAAFLGVIYLFEKRSFALFLINGGYCTISLTIMGMILGAM